MIKQSFRIYFLNVIVGSSDMTFSSSSARLPSWNSLGPFLNTLSDLMVLITHKIDKNKMVTAINLIIQTFEGSICLGLAQRSLSSQQLLK